jgi:hypothetical protein
MASSLCPEGVMVEGTDMNRYLVCFDILPRHAAL